MPHDTNEEKKHKSHSCCWEQKQPSACGIPLEKHTQCCLCDEKPTPPPETSTWEDRFDETLKYAKTEYCPGCGLTKEGLRIIREEARREVLEKVTKWADENMADGDYTYEHLLMFLSKLAISDNEKK